METDYTFEDIESCEIVGEYNDEYYIESNASYDTFKKDVSINDIKEHSNNYTCD